MQKIYPIMHKFDYSFLSNALLLARLVNITAAISELRERENSRKADFPALFEKLESVAKVQSVKGSNAIEGIVTSDQRIEEIVNQNSAPLKPVSKTAQRQHEQEAMRACPPNTTERLRSCSTCATSPAGAARKRALPLLSNSAS